MKRSNGRQTSLDSRAPAHLLTCFVHSASCQQCPHLYQTATVLHARRDWTLIVSVFSNITCLLIKLLLVEHFRFTTTEIEATCLRVLRWSFSSFITGPCSLILVMQSSQLVSPPVCDIVFFTFIIHVSASFQLNHPICENKERRKVEKRKEEGREGRQKGNLDPNDPLHVNWNIKHYSLAHWFIALSNFFIRQRYQ